MATATPLARPVRNLISNGIKTSNGVKPGRRKPDTYFAGLLKSLISGIVGSEGESNERKESKACLY